MAKRALITGITGQDGTYLAELLLSKGYEVHGIQRHSSTSNTHRIDHLLTNSRYKNRLQLHYGDLTDTTNVLRIVNDLAPDEIYNLGALSHVQVSFEAPEYTANVDGLGTLRLLDAIRTSGLEQMTRFYQASTSELYGRVQETPQTESTPFYPRSPYGAAKLYAYWITVNYREAYGLFACNGILFNHESPIRGDSFVTRKVTKAAARISQGVQDCVYLGNLDAKRDWGYAKDYVDGMWMMLQQDEPADYVLATGVNTSVRQMVEMAFRVVGIEIQWQGDPGSLQEVGVDKSSRDVLVRIDPKHYRPTEVETLLGNPRKAKEDLGWQPRMSAADLITLMVRADLRALRDDHGPRSDIPLARSDTNAGTLAAESENDIQPPSSRETTI